jgi:hypothetical protein
MNMVKRTMDEIKAWADSPEGKTSLAETAARLKAMPKPTIEDPENPWLTENDFAKAMTLAQRDEYLATRRKTFAVV